MNSTNRILNRSLLLVCGLLFAAVGATAIVAGTQPQWAEPLMTRWTALSDATISQIDDWMVTLPGMVGVPGAVIVSLIIAVVLTIILVAFVFTRGGGKIKTVLSFDEDSGFTSVDRNVADAVLTGKLSERLDVLSARTGVYRVKGAPAIQLTVTVRNGADLRRVLLTVEDTVQAWDELAGVRVPVMVHLSDRGWLDGLRSSVRVI